MRHQGEKMNKMITIAVALVVIIAGAAATIILLDPGSNNNERTGTPTVITDDMGRDVTVYLPVERVCMPSSDSFRSYIALEGENGIDRLVGGVGDFEGASAHYYDAFCEIYPGLKDLPGCGDFFAGTFSMVKIIDMNPDVVILPTAAVAFDLLKAPDLQRLDSADIPYVFVDFYMDPFGEGNYERNMGIMGKVLQKEERAAEISAYFQEQVAKAYDVDLTGIAKPNVFIEIMQGPAGSPLGGYNTTSAGAPEIDYGQGYNIARNANLPGGFGDVNLEFLQVQNPDVVILAASTSFGLAEGMMFGYGSTPTDAELEALLNEYLNRTGWSDINAVKNGNVYIIYAMFRSNVECFATLQYAATVMYPEQYADLDPRDALVTFYEKFMPMEYKGVFAYGSDGIF